MTPDRYLENVREVAPAKPDPAGYLHALINNWLRGNIRATFAQHEVRYIIAELQKELAKYAH